MYSSVQLYNDALPCIHGALVQLYNDVLINLHAWSITEVGEGNSALIPPRS